MKNRYWMVLAGALTMSLSVSSLALAEETTEAAAEEVTEEAAEENEEAEEEAEEEEEAEVEEEAEAEEEAEEEAKEIVILPRPDVKVLDFVTLGEYKGLTVSVPEVNITDDIVEDTFENVMQNYISQMNLYDYVEEGTLQEGDTANIDYVGKKDDVAFDGGTASGYDLTLGSGTFIPGFEEGLIGVAVGETVDIPLTFPEEYHSEELAGQDVIFTVTVNSIRTMPEYTDEMAAELSSGEYETIDALKEGIKGLLVQQAENNQNSQLFADLLSQINENSEIGEVPAEFVDYELSINEYYASQQALSYGMTLEDMMSAYGMTLEEYEEEMRASITENIFESAIPLAIAEAEEMTISEEEYAAKMAELAETASQSAEEYTAFLEERYPRDFLEMSFLLEKVQDFLKENTNIVYTSEEDEAEEAAVEEEVEEIEEEVEEELEEEPAEAGTEEEAEAETEAEEETEGVG